MKRQIAVLLFVVITLITTSVFTISSSAETEGEWDIAARPDEPNALASGYYYTESGLVTVSSDYLGYNAYQQAHTKSPIDLKGNNDGNGNSISVKMTVLDFVYDGKQGNDTWISFTINSMPVTSQGSTQYGEGLCILIRGSGDGRANIQPFYVDATGNKGFSQLPVAFPTIDVPMNDQGQEVYTFTLKYDGNKYTFAINDYWFATDAYLNDLLYRVNAGGAYLGVSMFAARGLTRNLSMCINEFQGAVPYGTDSRPPEPYDKSEYTSEQTTAAVTQKETTSEPYTSESPTETEEFVTEPESFPERDTTDFLTQPPITETEQIWTEYESEIIEHENETNTPSNFLNSAMLSWLLNKLHLPGCNSIAAAPAVMLVVMLGLTLIYKKKE